MTNQLLQSQFDTAQIGDTALNINFTCLRKFMSEPQPSRYFLESTLVCPHCGYSKTEQMPTDACQWFYECRGCHSLLKPKPGDCCVFCSYGSVPCPPIQLHGKHSDCCGTG